MQPASLLSIDEIVHAIVGDKMPVQTEHRSAPRAIMRTNGVPLSHVTVQAPGRLSLEALLVRLLALPDFGRHHEAWLSLRYALSQPGQVLLRMASDRAGFRERFARDCIVPGDRAPCLDAG